jgi:hypothetical protein
MKSVTKKVISPGTVHSVPRDLRKVLISDPAARAKWEDITPLARNEWICWVISVKKPETRRQYIERVRTEHPQSAFSSQLGYLPVLAHHTDKFAGDNHGGVLPSLSHTLG